MIDAAEPQPTVQPGLRAMLRELGIDDRDVSKAELEGRFAPLLLAA